MSTARRPRVARVAGSGIAAATAALSLKRFGWEVAMAPSQRRRGHAVALNGTTRYLLERICGPGLLQGLPRHHLRHRLVLWRDGAPQRLDDAAAVVDGAALAERMLGEAEAVGVRLAPMAPFEGGGWTVLATGRAADDAAILSGGRRIALSAPVVITTTTDECTLMIEAGATGWMALLPTGERRGVLFAGTLPSAEAPDAVLQDMVAQSHMIRHAIAAPSAPPAVLAAAPALRRGPGEGAAVFAGDAALAFDPISGDGVGTALRTAHLAAALGEAYARGTALGELHAFHAWRLARAMSIHLRGLLGFYGEAPFADHWRDECAAMGDLAALLQQRVAADVRLFAISAAGLQPLR